MKKRTIADFEQMKKEGQKATWITAYDYLMASYVEAAGIDMILVGDSLGNVIMGYKETNPVTMDQCINCCQAVKNGASNTFIVGDMPFASYQISTEEAVRNACRFVKEASVDAVKLEGGKRVADRIRSITNAGMIVCGHIGLTPQNAIQLGGMRAQGRDAESAKELIEDALCIQEAGARMLLIEAIPPEVTGFIAEKLEIPVYSIGAGLPCDGQLINCADILGMFTDFTPKFVKKYANIGDTIIESFQRYKQEVIDKEFPGREHEYSIKGDISSFEKVFLSFK